MPKFTEFAPGEHDLPVATYLERAEALLTRVESEGRDLADDEREEYDLLLARAEKRKRLDRVREAAQDPRNVEPAVAPPASATRTRTTPWDGLDRAGSVDNLDTDTGLRTRAATAVEAFADLDDAARERLAAMLDRDQSAGSARFVLALGNPAYERAFANWLRDPVSAAMSSTPEELAAWRDVVAVRSALSESNASALLPLVLDPAITLTNNGIASQVRRYADTRVTTTNQYRAPISAGVTAEWKAEGVEAADASPTITGADINIYQGFASVKASYELLDDTNFAAQLGKLIADARELQEGEAFCTGSGSGAPYGFVTRLAATTNSRISATTGGTFSTASVVDVFRLRDAVPARHRQGRPVWSSNISIASIVQQMSPAANGSSFWANLGQDVPASLLGIPFAESSSMVATTTTGSVVMALADLSQYFIVDRLGTSVEVHNVVGGSGRSTGQREFTARWRTGADFPNPNAGRVLKT